MTLAAGSLYEWLRGMVTMLGQHTTQAAHGEASKLVGAYVSPVLTYEAGELHGDALNQWKPEMTAGDPEAGQLATRRGRRPGVLVDVGPIRPVHGLYSFAEDLPSIVRRGGEYGRGRYERRVLVACRCGAKREVRRSCWQRGVLPKACRTCSNEFRAELRRNGEP